MNEQTLVLIKPDAMGRELKDEIIKRFKDGGLKIVKISEPFIADDETVRKHYKLDDYDYILTLGHVDVTGWTQEQKDEKYKRSYKVALNLIEQIKSGPIIKIILEGENAVARVREIVGKTDPAKSPKGTIRGDLGDDAFEFSDKEERAVRNLVHASGTPDEAKEEIELWFGK